MGDPGEASGASPAAVAGSRFEAAFANAPIGMSVVSPVGRCLEANDAFCRLLGYHQQSLVGLNLFELTHPDDQRAARDNWRRLIEGTSDTTHVELRYIRRDATEAWVAITSTMLRDAAGSPLYAVSQTEDITPRKKAEDARRQMEKRYGDLFERSNDMIFTLDLAGLVTSVNPAAERITGFAPDELVGTRLLDLVTEGEAERAGKLIDRLLDGHDCTAELEIQTKDGRQVFIETSARLAKEDDRPIGIDGIARDTTERRALQNELERQAFYDSLTGLPNRALFLDRLNQAVARLKRPGETVAVMLLGLDNFKAVNSRLGHGGGDTVLKELTPLIEEKLRGSDTVARLGGDQFGLIVENLQNEEVVLIVAERILGAVSGFRTEFGPLSASLGVAIADQGASPDALLENAHTAMHEAKRTNRGGLELFGADVHALHPTRAQSV
ncbi:MAG TPA: PAS domain S-box protein [Gaiellaceae bacterium]|jgi:diguanylate cyclase (GGDEF)-like protein/PAS domain S-box-containing protein|nr:PAS domain S-box protein [Gaiellaceae bacterium]